MKSLGRGNIIYLVVLAIAILLITNIFLTEQNNKIIKSNHQLQAETEQVKVYYDQIGKLLIHALNLGLRGYAIGRTEGLSAPMYNAVTWQDSILRKVEEPLKRQNYDLREFNILKDSLNHYVSYCFYLKKLLDEGKEEEFYQEFKSDRGAYLWGQYVKCEESIKKFENRINQAAEQKYIQALERNRNLQILIFFICVPTLLFTAFFTRRTFTLSELLRKSEEENNIILSKQNAELERLVNERTKEIVVQNEKILCQSQELSKQKEVLARQNLKLQKAQTLIEEKNKEIHLKNQELELEVRNRTLELQNANLQLVDHNNQLEQFSFITAHNLRAPLSRILGLANVMEVSEGFEEKEKLMKFLVSSTRDLDGVIKDLNTILEIKKHTGNFVTVDLPTVFNRVIKILEKEITETGAEVHSNFNQADEVVAVAPYVESIFYNLISNAIKYRSPSRSPIVTIVSEKLKDFILITVSDNGLGIDLTTYKEKIFNLYKRFHLHMEGKGLGLYLVKTQIMSLGGKVEVESEPDKGTKFRIYFRNSI